MKDLSNEIENARINAVQSDFDRREAQGEEMEAEREIEAAEKANNLRADLQYLIKKHSVASVNEMIQELTKPADSFIMIVEQTNVGSTAVVMVTGETANEDDIFSIRFKYLPGVEVIAAGIFLFIYLNRLLQKRFLNYYYIQLLSLYAYWLVQFLNKPIQNQININLRFRVILLKQAL